MAIERLQKFCRLFELHFCSSRALNKLKCKNVYFRFILNKIEQEAQVNGREADVDRLENEFSLARLSPLQLFCV